MILQENPKLIGALESFIQIQELADFVENLELFSQAEFHSIF